MDNNNNYKQGCDVTKKSLKLKLFEILQKNTNILAIVTQLDSIKTKHFKSLKTDLFGVRELTLKTKMDLKKSLRVC